MEPSSKVSKAPQPRPWSTRAPMHEAKPSPATEAQTEPATRSRAEARYTGRLPQSLAAMEPARPVTVDKMTGTEVSAAM